MDQNNLDSTTKTSPTEQTVLNESASGAVQTSKKSSKKIVIWGCAFAFVGALLVLMVSAGTGAVVVQNGQLTGGANEVADSGAYDDSFTEFTNRENTLRLFVSSYLQPASEDCAESGNFVDVSKYVGPGESYGEPTLSVTCDGDEFTVTSNNLPLWEYVKITPGDIEAQEVSFTIPRNPTIASEPTQIGYQDSTNSILGDLGFTVSGLAWYGPTEGPPYGDPNTNTIIDDCGGHGGPGSKYHEHILVTKCFFPDWTEDKAAPIVGYALDGFPVYGPTGYLSSEDSSVVTLKSSYQVTGDLKENAWDNVEYVTGQGAEYLDECNGRIQSDGSYGYHLTESFPYIIGCFKGGVASQNDGEQTGGRPER